MSGLLDGTAIESVGKILGLEAIVIGSIADLGNDVKINARLIAVDTARIFAVASARIPKVGTVENLIRVQARRGGQLTTSAEERPAAIGFSAGPVPGSSEFRNSFLHVQVRSAGLAKNRKQLTLALSVQNTLAEDLYLALDAYSKCALVDDKGTRIPVENVNGLVYVASTGRGEKRKYTRISGGSSTVVVFSFESKSEIPGAEFHFGGNFYRLLDEGYEQIPIGIAGIRLEK